MTVAEADHGAPIPRVRVIAATAAVGAVVFALLRLAIRDDGWLVAVDRGVLRWVLAHRSDPLTTIMTAVTTLGDLPVVVLAGAIAVTALVRARRGELATALVVSSAGTWLLVNGIKLLVQRPRPPEGVRLVHAAGWAFPSGHAGQSAAMYVAIGLLAWFAARAAWVRWTLLATTVVLALGIGSSRVYLGVHWMSDVVAGWSLGLAWFLAVLGVTTAWVRRPRADGSGAT